MFKINKYLILRLAGLQKTQKQTGNLKSLLILLLHLNINITHKNKHANYQ